MSRACECDVLTKRKENKWKDKINKFQKITRIRLNFNKLKFYLKHLKVESNSLTVLNEVLNIKK